MLFTKIEIKGHNLANTSILCYIFAFKYSLSYTSKGCTPVEVLPVPNAYTISQQTESGGYLPIEKTAFARIYTTFKSDGEWLILWNPSLRGSLLEDQNFKKSPCQITCPPIRYPWAVPFKMAAKQPSVLFDQNRFTPGPKPSVRTRWAG